MPQEPAAPATRRRGARTLQRHRRRLLRGTDLRVPGVGVDPRDRRGGARRRRADRPRRDGRGRMDVSRDDAPPGRKAVVARVSAMEFVKGVGEGTAAETRSAADGSFELRVVSQAGNKILLKAESDDPRAVSARSTPIPLDAGRPSSKTSSSSSTRRRSRSPSRTRGRRAPPGCPVQFDWEKTGESSYRGSQRTTDADGRRARVPCPAGRAGPS